MRWAWVWIVTAVFASVAHATVTGRVTAIGFQSFIRLPEWTPLVIQTTSDEPAPHTYDLQVVQTDLDGDEVVYTRTGITVNNGTQTFRTYFRPETSNGGLPVSGTESGNEFAKRMRVFLYDPATNKRAVRVGVAGALPQAMENGQMAEHVGQKLILVVGRSPSTIELTPGNERVVGLGERRYFVQMDPARLPDSPLAYAAVDTIVWTDADAARITASQMRAVRQFVQNGGTLAVVQNADRGRSDRFDDMLPVKVIDVTAWESREPLMSILQPKDEPVPRSPATGRPVNAWQFATPPWRMADATAADDTVRIDEWTVWPDKHRSPLIARRVVGLGCVAWIAQDISDPALAGVSFGWPRLWAKLLDWRDTDFTFTTAVNETMLKLAKERYAADTTRDLGASFNNGLNPSSRTIALLSLTFVFFVVYWALAGPVSYFVLAARHRTSMSWFAFGAIAAVATVLTIGIARLVLGGEAQAKHVSLVRVRPGGEPARVMARLGVYLPRDTTVPVALPQTENAPPAALSPLEADPNYTRDNVTQRDSHYEVTVGADADVKAVTIDVPFRSTLKKMQADWSGSVAGGISGQPRVLNGDVPLDGRLTNETGFDLRDVLILFNNPNTGGDAVISMPDWKKGQTFDLGSLWKSADVTLVSMQSGYPGLPVLTSKITRGTWANALTYLYEDLRRGTLTTPTWDDSEKNNYRSFPLVSFFGRCPPMVNYPKDPSRVDLLRRGVRQWDVSPAVAGGALVVIGQADGPMPIPLTVNGETPKSDGRDFFQAIVPADRSVFNNPDVPTTQPN